MARKSRKQIAVEEPVIESASSEVFSTAIYARLSVENSGKSEKVDVIANQIEICKSYIAERPYLNLIDTYVDNGRTGTVFDRPEFNRLMKTSAPAGSSALWFVISAGSGEITLRQEPIWNGSFRRSGFGLSPSKRTTTTLIRTAPAKASSSSAKHDQHTLLERHLPQGFYRAQGTDGKRRVQEAQSPVWLSLG